MLLRSYARLTLPVLIAGFCLWAMPVAAQSGSGVAQHAPVRVQAVQFTDFAPAVTLTGEVVARNEIPLSFSSGGRVTEVSAEVGDHVEKGALLARLEAKAQEAAVQAAQAGVAAAQAALDQASSTLARTQALFNSGVATRSALEQAQTAKQTAASRLASARAQVDTAQKSLEDTNLIASVSGIVIRRQVSAAEIAGPGATAFVIAEDGPRDARFFVPEAILLSQISQTPGTITSLDDPSATATGVLQSISPNLDPSTGAVQVKFEITNPSKEMELGSAIVGTTKVEPTSAVVLPWTALWSMGSEPAVWLVDPDDNSVSLAPVTIKVHLTGAVVISSGLSEGDLVVIDGAKMLHPGQIVSPSEE